MLTDAEPDLYAELHPRLAASVGVGDGDAVRLSTRRGTVVATARLTPGIRPDTVFLPFHWARVNDLTSARLDPTSRMPEFKTCAVAVDAVRYVPDETHHPGSHHPGPHHPGPHHEENDR